MRPSPPLTAPTEFTGLYLEDTCDGRPLLAGRARCDLRLLEDELAKPRFRDTASEMLEPTLSNEEELDALTFWLCPNRRLRRLWSTTVIGGKPRRR